GHVHVVDVDPRPGRAHPQAARLSAARLGGRAGRGHRPHGAFRRQRAGARLRVGVHDHQRRERAGLPVHHEPVDGREDLRDCGARRPYIADRKEITDPHALELRTWVNGKQMQSGNTKTFIFDVRYLVSYLSGLMTLAPGDLIATGTPPGVGLGKKPPVYLQPGDVVTM